MDPSESEVQEVEKSDPDLSVTRDETENSVGELNTTCVSALDMILESLWQLKLFQMSTEDKSVIHERLLNDLSLNHPLEVFDLFVNILDNLPHGDSYFEVIEVAKKICNRCKMDTEYPSQRSYGLILNANSLREVKSAFMDFTFENIVKIIKMNLKMPCDKEGCGKQNYVQHMINKLPPAFTIAIEWEKNETEGEIFDTTSVLATEIDISVIYQYKGDSAFTKYRLVSMVCLHGDRYNCVAHENNRWVRYSRSEKEIIGDWDSVVNIFKTQKMQPQILFFESGTGEVENILEVATTSQAMKGTEALLANVEMTSSAATSSGSAIGSAGSATGTGSSTAGSNSATGSTQALLANVEMTSSTATSSGSAFGSAGSATGTGSSTAGSNSATGSGSRSNSESSSSSGGSGSGSDDGGDCTTDCQVIQMMAYENFIAGRDTVTVRDSNLRTSMVQNVPSLLLQAFNTGWNFGNSAPPETAFVEDNLPFVLSVVNLASFQAGLLLESWEALFDHETPKNLPTVYFAELRASWMFAGICVGSYMLGAHGYVKDLGLLNFLQFFSFQRF